MFDHWVRRGTALILYILIFAGASSKSLSSLIISDTAFGSKLHKDLITVERRRFTLTFDNGIVFAICSTS